MTYTVAIMEVPARVFAFVERKLQEAGYNHAIHKDDDGPMLDMTHIGLKIGNEFDTCEFCGGLKGGVAGNENLIGGITTCDYCHGKMMNARGWTLAGFQHRIGQWVFKTFGNEVAGNAKERCLRLVEEAVELAQSCEVDPKQLHALIDYVYERPVGLHAQEIAGTMVTLAACAEALSVDLERVSLVEADRIETPEITEKVRNRQAEKRARLMTDG